MIEDFDIPVFGLSRIDCTGPGLTAGNFTALSAEQGSQTTGPWTDETRILRLTGTDAQEMNWTFGTIVCHSSATRAMRHGEGQTAKSASAVCTLCIVTVQKLRQARRSCSRGTELVPPSWCPRPTLPEHTLPPTANNEVVFHRRGTYHQTARAPAPGSPGRTEPRPRPTRADHTVRKGLSRPPAPSLGSRCGWVKR